MTEEELALRLKSAFPATPPAGAALHARVEGKERDARRGIGRKRKGRAIFAGICATGILGIVASRIPVMILLYRISHATKPKTTYTERFLSSDPSQLIGREWRSGAMLRFESYAVDMQTMKSKGKNGRVTIVNGKNWFEWRSGLKTGSRFEKNKYHVIPRKMLGVIQLRPPLPYLEKDCFVEGKKCKVLVENILEFDIPKLRKIDLRVFRVVDPDTGRVIQDMSSGRINNGVWSENPGVMRYQYDIPIPDELFKPPGDVTFVMMPPQKVYADSIKSPRNFSEWWQKLLVDQ